MSNKVAHRAFTLIEMLVSLAIVSTIVTMVYGSYAATSRSLDVYSSRMACSERAHLVLRMMARQIRCAYVPATAMRSAGADDNRNSAPAAPTAVFRAEPRGLRGDILSFATTGGFGLGLDRPMGILSVAYRYDEPGRTLSICSNPWVYRTDSLRGSDTWQPVLTGITGIELGFYDGRNWQPRWDSKHNGQLPQAVRIALSVMDEHGRDHHYATAVPIVCQKTSQDQQAKKAVGRP